MKIVALVGIMLIVLGIVSLVFHGITYKTDEKVVDFGPVHASVHEKKTIPLAPVFGAILLASGVALLVASWKQPQ